MSFKGMDPQELRSFAARLDATAAHLQGAHGQLGGRLRQVPWHGAVAERFTGDWFGPYQSQVSGACRQLTELASRLRAEAAAQETASGPGGFASAATGVGRFGFGSPGFSALPTKLLPRGPILHPGMHLPPGVLVGLAGGAATLLQHSRFTYTERVWPENGIKRPTMEQRLTTLVRSGTLTGGVGVGKSVSATTTKQGHIVVGGVPMQGSASATAYAEAHAGAHGSISAKGVDASMVAGAGVGATAGVAGLVGSRNLGVGGGASVSAQASAKAEAAAHVGKDGAKVKAGVEAGASVSADANVTAHTGGVDTSLGAHAYAGVQAHAQAEAAVTAHDVKAHVSIGAALGVGAGVDVTVEVHPDQVWNNVRHIKLPPHH